MNELFEGKALSAKDGSTVTPDSLAGKTVGIYFSAHWCPPCKAFTPRAAATYEKVKEAGKPFEVVFVSSDKDQAAFNEYRSEMPWLALPFEHRDLKNKLARKFKVSGIPMLIILDGSTGKIINKEGRGALSRDPTGANFPWRPPTAFDAIGPVLVKPDKTEVDAKTLQNKFVALYFSASWCGPCKAFTPKLIEAYKKVRAQREDFEVVFVSGDRSDSAFQSYFGGMPWLALPYSERERESQLQEMFEVEGIPTAVMIGPDGKVINSDLVSSISSDPESKDFPWRPKPVQDLEEAASKLNEVPTVLVFHAAKDQEKAAAALQSLAKEHFDKAAVDEDAEEIAFCTAAWEEGMIVSQVRRLLQLGDSLPASGLLLAMIDIPDDGGFYIHDGEVTEKSVRDFLTAYKAKSLTRKQMSRG